MDCDGHNLSLCLQVHAVAGRRQPSDAQTTERARNFPPVHVPKDSATLQSDLVTPVVDRSMLQETKTFELRATGTDHELP